MKISKVIATLLLISISSIFANERIVLGNYENPPYMSRQLQYYGGMSRIIKEAFQFSDINVGYKWFGYLANTAYYNAESGKVAGMFPQLKTEEKELKFYFSEPILTTEEVFFYNNSNNFDWNTIDDLKQLTIGSVIDQEHDKTYSEAIKSGSIKTIVATSNKENFQNLLDGKIDILLISKKIGLSILDKQFSDEERKQIKVHHKMYKKNSYSLILTKALPENEERLTKFNNGLRQLKENGKLDTYLQESISGKYKKRSRNRK